MQRRLITLAMMYLGAATAVILLIDGLSITYGAKDAVTTVTTVLYDGRLGTLPDDQSFSYGELPFPPFATQTISDSGVILDSTTSASIQAGYGVTASNSIILDRHTGYKVTFEAHVLTQTAVNNDRAGFSLIVLSEDLEGIELSFWNDQIFSQDDGGNLFGRGETANFDTMVAPTLYDLQIFSGTYTLSSSGTEIMNGRLRNYSAFEPPPGYPDPYETPSFIFLGDNTTSAQASVKIDYVAVRPNDLIFLPFAIRP